MTRKEASLLLSKYFRRYPKVVELNYYLSTGIIRRIDHFTDSDNKAYNPSIKELNRVFGYISKLLYVWEFQDHIRAKEEEAREASARKAYLEWEKEQNKALRANKTYLWRVKEEAIKAKIRHSNEAMLVNILSKHYTSNDITIERKWSIDDIVKNAVVPIPEDMWAVINRYK
jgi:hypothetical protein